MLEQLEALAALAEEGTMGRAGTRLRISQSAVSKRIAALEARLKRRLLQARGRRVELTAEGQRLIRRAGPLLEELRAAVLEEEATATGHLVVGVSESVLASWGAGLLARVRRELDGVSLELHAHRSPVVADRIRGGEYLLGLCAGIAEPGEELVGDRVLEETMVLIPSGLGAPPRRRGGRIGVLTIEVRSATWAHLAPRARELGLVPEGRLESFFAVAQAAAQGFGHGLVPLGVARALRIPEERLVRPGRGRLTRPVSLLARRRTLGRPAVRAFRRCLLQAARPGLEGLTG